MIKLQIIGNLGKDCITNQVNGKNVINFSVAHTEKFKDQQGNPKERTTWVECAYWTDRLGIAPYLKKGQTVYAEGTPDVEGYLSKSTNQPSATLRMRVQTVQLLGSKTDSPAPQGGYNNSSYNAGQPMASTPMPSEIAEAADDLPF
jgi:single-strand DNA-binding protein